MAIVNDYITGTITLTSGSANFTSTGAALQSANIRAGDEILLPAKGLVLVIASITGENAGTLVANCPAGAAGAAQPMRIRFQPDGSRYTAAARSLIEMLANGKLAALAALTGGADKLPFFNGGSTFDQTGFTAAARTLLDDPDVATMLSTLGLPFTSGSWTPSLNFGGAAVGMTYSSRSGSYASIGPMVFVRGDMILTAEGSSVGAATIVSLPFAPAPTGGGGGMVGLYSNMASVTVPTLLFLSTGISLYNGGGTGIAAMTNSNFNDNSRFLFSGVYLK